MALSPPFQFTTCEFIKDIRDVASLVGVPFSDSRTQEVLDVYSDSFLESAVIWRTTDRKEKQLNYRFYERRRRDCIGMAVKGGLLERSDPMAKLVTSWSALYGGDSRQSCDFDTTTGLVKTWVTFRGLRPLTDILSIPGVPMSMRRHETRLRSLGLQEVRHTCVDYQRRSINFYFETGKQISKEMAIQFTDLAGSQPPSPEIYADMYKYLSKKGFPFGVTMTYDGGDIERVCFYAMGLCLESLPRVDDSVAKFFAQVPCHDKDPFNVVAWSFSHAGMYIKVDRSYSGEMLTAIRSEGRSNVE